MIDRIERAQSLRRRLNDLVVDVELLAAEGADLFEEAGWSAQARWLRHELGGYGSGTDMRHLHEVLGVSASDRLLAHVAAYRVQTGRVMDGSGALTGTIRHFFVESLAELDEMRVRVRVASVSGSLALEFGPREGLSNYPPSAEFPHDVFERVLLGFRAALHLQLGSIQ